MAVKTAKKGPKKQTGKRTGLSAGRTAGSNRQPLLPEAFSIFLKNSGWRLAGSLLAGAAVLILLALISYNPSDPAVNNAKTGVATNWVGGVGANIADVLMQSIGYAGYYLILPFFIWGQKLIRLKWLPLFWLNLASVPFAALLLALAFSPPAPAPDFPVQAGYGGVLGQILYSHFIAVTGSFFILPVWVLVGLFMAIALPLAAFSLALTRLEWMILYQNSRDSLFWVVDKVVALALWITETIADLVDRIRDKAAHTGDADKPDTTKARTKRRSVRKPVQKRVRKPGKTKTGERETRERQITLDLGDSDGFRLPALGLLEKPGTEHQVARLSEDALEQNARMLESVLDDFGVQGQILDVRPGPVVTLYELEPARGTKSARVIGLADDIARSMSAISARVAVVPGRNAIGIELPNSERETVFLRALLSSADYEKSRAKLPIVLGKDIGGEPIVADLASMPHLLVAGTTGSGKSVGINTMIMSLLYRHTPDSLRMIMVDPKMLELSIYDDIPHLLTPVVTEPKKAVVALKWAVREMEDRYRNMSKLGVRNLAAFNKRVAEAEAKEEKLVRKVQTGFDKETGLPIEEEQEFEFETLPHIVIVIDEMADLMLVAGKDVEATVQRLAQMARAAGIHLIMATQRPSVDVITGTIKANFPTRISFQVTSKIDSRTILGEQGAEQLLGMGDMLYMAGGGRITRVHGAFVSDGEVEAVVGYLKKQSAPDYVSSVTEEPDEGFDSPFIPGPSSEDRANSLYDQAVAIVQRDRKASTSYIQRRLKIGYNKAANLIEEMEEQGVISAPNHKGQREVLTPDHEEEF